MSDVLVRLDDGTQVWRALSANMESLATSGIVQSVPVGGVFICTTTQDPATLLGYGTWERTAVGRFIVGLDENDVHFDVPGETGGA